jgi:hypothetical protein
MTVQRQSSLFAAEDWTAAYKAYSQVDFQAYDFDTMRGAMVDYIRTNFPENFNDYIESSEFIAIIELLAYLSQSLAFRMDLNSRENFLETAERRDSVYKLARMLGYNPKRNIPASGVLKITSIKTDEPLRDSLGTSLQNKTIYWDDTNNPQSYEQFITVMNAAMSETNRFSTPIREGTVGGVKTEIYQLNTPVGSPIAYNFNLTTSGETRPYNMVNPDFVDNGFFYERHPDPTNLFHMIYRNDSKGLSSADTGFFTMFRQGILNFVDFNYTTPVESRQEIINVQNINESDVYLQEIDTNGVILNKWEKVANVVGQTLNYNSKQLNSRNLYAIENRGADGIRLLYPDGNFGNIPVGIFRFWHRISDPVRFSIQPSDAQNISISIPYVNADGRSHSITVTASLQYKVANSLPAETTAAIKQRAPQVYYTQNRMVSAQDYNVFPESQSANITKIKATNKTHAGHSRYIDINDPTGTYNNLDTFAEDAYVYTENQTTTEQISVNSNTTPLEVAASVLSEMLKRPEINNFVYYTMRNIWRDPATNGVPDVFKFSDTDDVTWNTQPARSTGKRGFITESLTVPGTAILINNPNLALVTSEPRASKFRMLKENVFVKMVNPADESQYKWTRIVEVVNNGLLNSAVDTGVGPWLLSEEIPNGWKLREVIVSLRKLFDKTEAKKIENEIRNRRSFGLGYNLVNDAWYVIPKSDLNTTADYAIDINRAGESSWLLALDLVPGSVTNSDYRYNITMRGQNYVVQSRDDLRFYNVKNTRVLDRSNRSSQDLITLSTVNTKPSDEELFRWKNNQWTDSETNVGYIPLGTRTNIPLKTRSTTWRDVDVSWVSNFGIFVPAGNNLAEHVTNNRYVADATVPLNTYFTQTSGANDANVIIGNNTGSITSIPRSFRINFSDATFGTRIVDESEVTPFIAYRQTPDNGLVGSEVVFKALLNSTTYSYGVAGTTEDTEIQGRLKFIEWDSITKTGTLEYTRLNLTDYHYSRDITGEFSMDKIAVLYHENKEKLDTVIDWEIVDVYREPDGYTDPRKVKVIPRDSDGDLIPDRPLQFHEYVGQSDLVLFENYADFDGYIYDRPIRGVILDYRGETQVRYQAGVERLSPGSYEDFADLTMVNWILVDDRAVLDVLTNVPAASGIVVYETQSQKTYQFVPESTNTQTIKLVETSDYFVRQGRGQTQNTQESNPQDGVIRWRHIAPSDVRIDPSISNVVEMLVLTTSYYDEVRKWKARPTAQFPLPPTSNELSMEFAGLNTYKSASDTLVFRSAKFKMLFGAQADAEYKARFRVVKLTDNLSDNELKSRIIATINDYFDVVNWEFGETFYFTELATYIHQRLGSAIGSIVILPKNLSGTFGEMFQVKAEPNELFISTASVSDIEIVSRLDNQTLRVDR